MRCAVFGDGLSAIGKCFVKNQKLKWFSSTPSSIDLHTEFVMFAWRNIVGILLQTGAKNCGALVLIYYIMFTLHLFKLFIRSYSWNRISVVSVLPEQNARIYLNGIFMHCATNKMYRCSIYVFHCKTRSLKFIQIQITCVQFCFFFFHQNRYALCVSKIFKLSNMRKSVVSAIQPFAPCLRMHVLTTKSWKWLIFGRHCWCSYCHLIYHLRVVTFKIRLIAMKS